jgi:hypothetical protein
MAAGRPALLLAWVPAEAGPALPAMPELAGVAPAPLCPGSGEDACGLVLQAPSQALHPKAIANVLLMWRTMQVERAPPQLGLCHLSSSLGQASLLRVFPNRPAGDFSMSHVRGHARLLLASVRGSLQAG